MLRQFVGSFPEEGLTLRSAPPQRKEPERASRERDLGTDETMHPVMGDPAVFSLSRQNPPVSDAEASCDDCLSPSRRAPLLGMLLAPSSWCYSASALPAALNRPSPG